MAYSKQLEAEVGFGLQLNFIALSLPPVVTLHWYWRLLQGSLNLVEVSCKYHEGVKGG